MSTAASSGFVTTSLITGAGADAIPIYPSVADLRQSAPVPPRTASAISVASPAINYDLTTLDAEQYADRVCLQRVVPPATTATSAIPLHDELAALEKLSALLDEGQSVASTIYTYRLCSRALPMIQADTSDDMKAFVHQETFRILRPQIDKIRCTMDFHEKMIHAIVQYLPWLVKVEEKRGVHNELLLDLLIRAIDLMNVLDALKDMKGCMMNDFTRYKRSFTSIKATLGNSDAYLEEIRNLENFLSNRTHTHNLIMFHVKTDVQKVAQYDVAISVLLAHALDIIEKRRFVLPEEAHVYHRSLSVFLFLIDGDDKDAKKGVNVFRYSGKAKIDLVRVQKQVKLLPIVPLFMDMHFDVVNSMRRISHWDDKLLGDWVTAKPQKLVHRYSLTHNRPRIRQEFKNLVAAYSSIAAHVNRCFEAKQSVPMPLLEQHCTTLLDCLRALGNWAALVHEQSAFKFSRPVADDEYKRLKAQQRAEQTAATGATAASPPATASSTANEPGHEYEKSVKFNYTSEELYALVDVINMVKSLGAILLNDATKNSSLLLRYVHDTLQGFLLGDALNTPMRKADKHSKKQLLEAMSQIREIGADWFDCTAQKNAFKSKAEKADEGEPGRAGVDFIGRSVAPGRTQIALIRRCVHLICSDRSAGMQGSMFSEKDLKREYQVQWQAFVDAAHYFPYLLGYATNVRRCLDFSFLWYREFYLEMTRCIQFPISMSMPWILTEFLINSPFPSVKENVLMMLDIYDDAASQALYGFKQQFLFDEVEAELNISVSQFVFLTSADIWRRWKQRASQIFIPKSYENKWLDAKLKKSTRKQKAEDAEKRKWEVVESRYGHLMAQRVVRLLGRSLDMQMIFTQQLNASLRQHLALIVERFEGSDLTSVVSLAHALDHFRLLHGMLAQHLPALDDIDLLLNESTPNASLRERIVNHIVNELGNDLFANFVWNEQTCRLARPSRRFARVPDRSRIPSVLSVANGDAYFFGKRFGAMFDRWHQSFRGYFGREHFEALFTVLAPSDLPYIAQQVLVNLDDTMSGEFVPYMQALLTGMKPISNPKAAFGALGAYLFFEAKLRTSLGEYRPLRPGVFQVMRVMGNALMWLREFDLAWKAHEQFGLTQRAPFIGVRPWSSQERANLPLDAPLFSNLCTVTGTSPLALTMHDAVVAYRQAPLRVPVAPSSTVPPAALFESVMQLASVTEDVHRYSESDAQLSVFARALHLFTSRITQHYDQWYGAGTEAFDMTSLIACFKFMFTMVEDPSEPPLVMRDSKAANPSDPASQRPIPSDQLTPAQMVGRDYKWFGDGVVFLLATLLHVLGERNRLNAMDMSWCVYRMEQQAPADRMKFSEASKTRKKMVFTEQDKQEMLMLEFLDSFAAMESKLDHFTACLQSYTTVKVPAERRHHVPFVLPSSVLQPPVEA